MISGPAVLAQDFTYGGAVVRIYHANKNGGLEKHDHEYSHAMVCNSGSCLVSLEGRSYTIDKNSTPLNLPAGQWHEIEALEDNTVFANIFAEGKNK
jgi:quercetin dioxygenase-like cupin family protein